MTGDQDAKGGGWTSGPHPPSLTTRQRQGKQFKELDLSGLNSWPPELAEAAHQLLAKYHDVFCKNPWSWAALIPLKIQLK